VAVKGRWAISIDIEGFSKHYEYSEDRKTYAIFALGELMNSVFLVGSRCFPGTPEKNFSERLFAHQYGDAFLVCSNFPESEHKAVRYLDIHEEDQFDEAQFAAWVKQASQLRGWGKV